MFIRLAVNDLNVLLIGNIASVDIGWWEYDSVNESKSFKSVSIMPIFEILPPQILKRFDRKWLRYRDSLIPVEEVIDHGVRDTVVLAKTKTGAGSLEEPVPAPASIGCLSFANPAIVHDTGLYTILATLPSHTTTPSNL